MKKRHQFQGLFVLSLWIIIIPVIIQLIFNDINIGGRLDFPLNILLTVLGLIILCIGLWLLIKTNSLFIKVGKGTASPFAPPKNFVVIGIYQYVRNPMTIGIVLTILGESIILGSISIFFWSLVFLIGDHIILIIWEEPLLTKRFQREYIHYKKHVPRWIPRLKPWIGLSRARSFSEDDLK